MEATSSKEESALQKSSLDVHAESKWQYKSPSDTVVLSLIQKAARKETAMVTTGLVRI